MKNKFIKRSVAIISVLLTVLLALPFQAFASGGTYAVYEDFNSQSSVNGFKNYIHIATQTGTDSSGSITLTTNRDTKCLKYDKTITTAGKVAHYTDIAFGTSGTDCPQGTTFVFEVTFWYTGDLSNISWGELVGGRKVVDNKGNIKPFLQIKNGSLYSGAGTETSNLVTPLKENTPYTIAILVKDADNKYDIYLNGQEVAIQKNVEYKDTRGTDFTCIRALNLTGMAAQEGKIPDFYADDFKIYYADKPVCAGGVPSSIIGGATTGGGETGDGGSAGTQIPNDPVIPNTPAVPDSNTQTGAGTIKLPKVEQKEFEFTAAPQSTSKVESNPVKLEVKKDIIFISAIGCGTLAVIVLMKVFRKKIK